MCARSGPKLVSIRETKEFNLSKCALTGPNFRFQALARIGPGLYSITKLSGTKGNYQDKQICGTAELDGNLGPSGFSNPNT